MDYVEEMNRRYANNGVTFSMNVNSGNITARYGGVEYFVFKKYNILIKSSDFYDIYNGIKYTPRSIIALIPHGRYALEYWIWKEFADKYLRSFGMNIFGNSILHIGEDSHAMFASYAPPNPPLVACSIEELDSFLFDT